MLSDKAGRILKLLIENDKAPLTMKRIAALMEISERSVSTYLKEVQEFCTKEKIELVNKPGVGIFVKAGNLKDKLLHSLTTSLMPFYSAEFRVHYMISLLLNNWTTYTVSLFADDLYVSRSTVDSDLNEAQRWLADYGIEIVRKVGSGICLSGQEYDVRRAIVAINRVFLRHQDMIAETASNDYRVDEESYLRIVGNYKEPKTSEVIQILKNADREIGRILTNQAFTAILEYMVAQIKRIRLGYTLNNDFQVAEAFRETLEYKTAVRIAECVGSSFGIELNEFEVGYICILILSGDYHFGAQQREEVFSKIEPEVLQLAREIINYTGYIIGFNLNQDELLYKNLSVFLKPAIIRIKYGIDMPNPLLDEVKKNYPAIFSACFAAGRFIKEQTGCTPSENEVSYLSLIIGGAVVRSDKKIEAVIVCAGGIGTAQLVAKKVERALPEINIVNILPYTMLEESDSNGARLIITTIPSLQTARNMVYITPVVTEEDVRRLKRACSEVFTKNREPVPEVTILDILHDDLIFINVSFSSKEKILRYVSGVMENADYVKEGFLEDMLHRERLGSTALGKGVAIPHGISGLVKKPAISLVRLNESIDWGGEPVDIIFVLALNFVDIENTKAFFKCFYSITSEDSVVERIRKAQSKDEVKQIIIERGIF